MELPILVDDFIDGNNLVECNKKVSVYQRYGGEDTCMISYLIEDYMVPLVHVQIYMLSNTFTNALSRGLINL